MFRCLCGVSVALLLATSSFAADPPKVWAVVVGIDSYQDKSIANFPGAEGDSRAVYRWLVDAAGWDGRQILVMNGASRSTHDAVSERIDDLMPTRANLDWVLREWLPYRVRPGDVVLFYFAGQAVGGIKNDPNSHELLLPIDAQAKQLEKTGWSLPNALDRIASKGENPILIWLDTSLSGRGNAPVDLAGRRTDPDRLLGELTRWPGTSAWIAAAGRPSLAGVKARERSPFVISVLAAMGTAKQPINLLGGLFTASREPRLAAAGLRAAGALGPNLSLWPKQLAETVSPPSEFLLQRGHADRLTGAVFSSDGGTMITASEDSTIKVWQVSERRLLRTLPAHMIGVSTMALSSDGSMLASGDGAGRVILWSLADFRARRPSGPSPHSGGISRVVFLGDANTLASVDSRGRVVIWKTANRALRGSVLVESATAIASDGQNLAVALKPANGAAVVRIYGADGKPIRDLKGASGLIPNEGLALREDIVAAGDQAGLVLSWKLASGEILTKLETGTPIVSLALSPTNVIAATGDRAWTVPLEGDSPTKSVKLGGTASRVAVSSDGKSAAANTDDGKVVAWRIQNDVTPVDLKATGSASTVLAFPPHSERLVSGDQDGGIRFWEWPSGAVHSRINAGRSKIDALTASADGRYVAQIDHDWTVRIWDLKQGRGLTRIPGEWVAASFSSDGKILALTGRNGAIRLVDPMTTETMPARFDPPLNAKGDPSLSKLGPVAVSPDGKWVAAGSREGSIAAVWPIAGGKPSKTIREHDDRISAIGFSSDSLNVITGSLDGLAKIWALDGEAPKHSLKAEPLDEENADPAVTAARIAPGPLAIAVTGHRDGRVIIWNLKAKDGPVPLVMGRFEGPVSSLEFAQNGERLIVGGWDKTVRLWTKETNGWVSNDPVRLEPQHTERVEAVIAPANGKYLASAGYDGLVRFWKPDGASLLGTVSTCHDDGTWVAFDQAGHFDSAPGGEIHVTFLQAGKILSLDQSDTGGRIFGLGSHWHDGKIAPGESPLLASRPPGLAIDPPSNAVAGEVELRIHVGDASAADLRLYQNDVPVRTAEDFRPGDDPSVRLVKVRLGAGENRFFAMAPRSEPGSVLGRSNAVTLRGPTPDLATKGRVHMLALGVSKYDSNALEFADFDASEFANHLERNGYETGRQPGITKILLNKDVRTDIVETALREIRDASKPEDTVVVFLAGHTDVRRDDRFCLLLDKFPFAPNALSVGQRGPIQSKPNVAETEIASTILPYALIYRTLSRVDARNRLVVIDACQAGAIFDDPAIQRIQRKTEDAAHEARTSYLLAARKGEPAGEAALLKHGLMTYLLLLGMGSANLEPAPGGSLGHADNDGDKTITTEELRQYLDINLPILASRVSAGMARSNPKVANPPVDKSPEPIKGRGATTAFPVAKLPR